MLRGRGDNRVGDDVGLIGEGVDEIRGGEIENIIEKGNLRVLRLWGWWHVGDLRVERRIWWWKLEIEEQRKLWEVEFCIRSVELACCSIIGHGSL